MRRRDFADLEADRIMTLLWDGASDEELMEAIAEALRKAKGVEKPPSIRRPRSL